MGKMGLKGVPGLNLVSEGGGGRQNQKVRYSSSLKCCVASGANMSVRALCALPLSMFHARPLRP